MNESLASRRAGFEKKHEEIVDRLHALAEDVRRCRPSGRPCESEFAMLAGEITSTVTSAVANLGLHALIQRGSAVDRVAAEERSSGPDDQLAKDAKELLDLFIEGGYIEDGDEALIDRLHARLKDVES